MGGELPTIGRVNRAASRSIGAAHRNLLVGGEAAFTMWRVNIPPRPLCRAVYKRAGFLPRSTGFLIAAVLLARMTASALAEDVSITQVELVRRTQEMADTLPSGDQTPWKKYYAEDCLYHDEKGRSFDKTGLLSDISPFPKGYSGSIRIVSPKSLITRDCAILSYDMEETETIFGQEMHARYHQTDTWLLRSGGWQIAATEVMRYYEDPSEGEADPARFAAYVGSYELSKDSDRRTVISVEGGHLMMERTQGTKTPLFTEAPDLFFRRGIEGRILFHLGADGKADAFFDRRNNEDVVWRKTR